MLVVFTDAAESDFETIGDAIAAANPDRAVSFVRELRQACLGLSDMPRRFAPLQRRELSGIRRRVHGNYLIFFRIEADTVEIIHILHGAMDYEPLLFPSGEDGI